MEDKKGEVRLRKKRILRLEKFGKRGEKVVFERRVEEGIKREKEKTRIKDTVIKLFLIFFDHMIKHNIIYRYLKKYFPKNMYKVNN